MFLNIGLSVTLLLNQEAIEREFLPADKQMEISSDADLDVDSESNKIEMMGQNLRTGVHENIEVSDDHEKGKSKTNGSSSVCSDSALLDESEPRGTKRSHDSEELEVDNKKTRPVVIDIVEYGVDIEPSTRHSRKGFRDRRYLRINDARKVADIAHCLRC